MGVLAVACSIAVAGSAASASRGAVTAQQRAQAAHTALHAPDHVAVHPDPPPGSATEQQPSASSTESKQPLGVTTKRGAGRSAATPNAKSRPAAAARWRAGAEILPFENVEGILLIDATLSGGGHDTTGAFALDTGAGYMALDADLARILEIGPATASSASIGTADKPLERLRIGHMQFDQVEPVLTIDAGIVRQVTERPVLGLIGAHLLAHHALVIDYRAGELGLVPVAAAADSQRVAPSPKDAARADGRDRSADERRREAAAVGASRASLADALHSDAVAIAFRLAGDDKLLVTARVSGRGGAMSDTLTLVLDTGATKTALFAHALGAKAVAFESWPSLRGLTAPTLVGSEDARLARIRRVVVGQASHTAHTSNVDVAVLDSPLERALSAEVGEPVDGLLGYSFLRRFRLVIDYPHRVLWLEPVPHTYDERPYEYSHVGLQIERREGALKAVGVATGSPADLAGIDRDDEIVAIDDKRASELDAVSASKLLEGPPGSVVQVTMRRGTNERSYRLVRRRLL